MDVAGIAKVTFTRVDRVRHVRHNGNADGFKLADFLVAEGVVDDISHERPRRKAGLVSPEVEGYRRWLTARGYTPLTVRNMLNDLVGWPVGDGRRPARR